MEEPTKILMTADTIGGVWTYALHLCKALEPYNAAVHLCTMGRYPSAYQLNQLKELNNTVFYPSAYKLEWMEDSDTDVRRAARWLRDIYEEVKPDILHFNNFGQTDQQWDCPVITVYHSCVHTWWKAVHNEPLPAYWQGYSAVLKNALERSDFIITPTLSMRKQVEEAMGSQVNFDTFYNGIPIQRKDFKKEPFILTAGRIWDDAKNINLLCRIADKLPWPVYVAGDNSKSAIDIAYNNVRFLGQLDYESMQDLMGNASIFVMPSMYEPFGLAVLEAASAGCALVLSDIPTFRELWGDAASYFDLNNEQELLQTLFKLIEDDNCLRQYGERACEKSSLFTADAMATSYYTLYKQLIIGTNNSINKIA